MSYYNKDAKDVKKYISNSNTSTPKFKYIVLIAAVVACHAKRKKLTRKTKKTLLNTTFKSVFYYL